MNIRLVLLAALALVPALPQAHLCDNVYRQADKVIIKPEFTNLIIKDEATFKVFVQNNMDRGVESAGLEAESEAFDATVEPHAMELPKAKSERDRVFFTVKIKLKPGFTSGSYKINFRLVGRPETGVGREIARYTADPGALSRIPPAPSTVTVKAVKAGPVVDGKLDDAAWREAGSFTGFRLEDGTPARNQTTGLLVRDRDTLYLGLALSDEAVDRVEKTIAGGTTTDEETDRVYLLLNPSPDVFFRLEVDCRGQATLFKVGLAAKPVKAAVRAATRADAAAKTWFLEAALPLKAVGGLKPGASWKVNVVRFRNHDRNGECGSSWAGLPSLGELPANLGTVRFTAAAKAPAAR
jgi:hypothetical protein